MATPSPAVRFVASLVASTLGHIALIIVPAWAATGRIDWARGWVVIGIVFVSSAVGGLWFLVKDPDLIRERATLPRPQSPADRRATFLIGGIVIVWLVASAIDGARLDLLPSSPSASLWGGLALYLLGLGLIVWTMKVNSFAALVVKVQRERHHRVIDTGPYAIVRHPMYLGAIFYFAGIALMLQSTALALSAPPVFVAGLYPRIQVEEDTLRRGLEGYADYQRRVRYRILPGLL